MLGEQIELAKMSPKEMKAIKVRSPTDGGSWKTQTVLNAMKKAVEIPIIGR